MMHTTHKNRTGRESKEKESSVDPVAKKQKALLNFTSRSGGVAVASFVETSSMADPVVDVVEVSMEDTIREEMDSHQCKAWTVRLPDPSRSQAFEVCTLEDPDEWWAYQ